jgi:response regulator RpfG family c-di-GMP phosphodiesterase
MKLVRTLKDEPTGGGGSARVSVPAWKLLAVDDEPDVLQLTRLNLKGFQFAGRGLEIIEATSAAEARAMLAAHPDIAVALIDVVMETDDAGLRLVEHIRKDLKNEMIRLVIRTGQPGIAPERYVIDQFDIDDYKDKTELTATRLYTTVRSAIKSYRDLKTIDLNRIGLSHVLGAAPDIYRLANASLNQFFEGVLTQIVGLCNLSESSFMATLDGVVATFEGHEICVRAACGHFADTPRFEEIRSECSELLLHGRPAVGLPGNALVIPLSIGGSPVGFVYIETTRQLSQSDRDLVMVLAQQCSNALENLHLHMDVKSSFDNAIDMLAEVAEFKDRSTGGHIARIDTYTRALAMELGVSADEADVWGKASRLHDVGKVGIPDGILRKPGKLTAEEYLLMQRHTAIGASLLRRDKFMELAREVALSHHERWDGKGYPAGRPGSELSLLTRIVSVVDVFDALVSRRPYKEPWGRTEAVAEIERCAGSQFDPVVVAAFLRMIQRSEFDAAIAEAGSDAVDDTDM